MATAATREIPDLRAASLKPDRLTLVSMATRPGINRFWMTLEYDHFPPRTPLNDEYDLTMLAWPDSGILWTIVIIPLAYRRVAAEVAAAAGMRLANGVPTLMSHPANRHVVALGAVRVPPPDAFDRFPLDHDRVFTMENDMNSPVYLAGGDAFIRAEELRWIEAFRKARGLT